MSKLPDEIVEHPIARICGVRATDTRIEVAEKVIATMRASGLAPRYIAEAERMLAEYKRRRFN